MYHTHIYTVDCISLVSSGSKSIQSLNMWPIRLRVFNQPDGGYITHVSCNVVVGTFSISHNEEVGWVCNLPQVTLNIAVGSATIANAITSHSAQLLWSLCLHPGAHRSLVCHNGHFKSFFPNGLKHHNLLVYKLRLLEVWHTTSKWFSSRSYHQTNTSNQCSCRKASKP